MQRWKVYILLFILFAKKQDVEMEDTLCNSFISDTDCYDIEMVSSKNDNITQLIINCEAYEKQQKFLESMGRIKYNLPMIHSYVLEVDSTNVKNILDTKESWQVEIDAHITAQMNRAKDIINLKWAHDHNIYGEGVGVAILDTGVSLHPDLVEDRNRIVAFVDFINGRKEPYDDNGHGTHVAGIIGGNGHESGGYYLGVAPKCNIISLKVLNHKGNGNISDVLAGLQWVINNRKKYNIRVVNISVGTSTNDSVDENSLLVKGVNAVWDNGIAVIVAAGNNGPKPMSISTPGISRKVITVGAYDDDIPVELSGSRSKDYSGRGPTNSCIKKPDIVAPGSNIVSCNVTKNMRTSAGAPLFPPRRNSLMAMYTTKSGTSMATPIVSGAVALLFSSEPDLTNKDVKLRLRNSGKDLGYPWSKQGWGLLNIKDMLE